MKKKGQTSGLVFIALTMLAAGSVWAADDLGYCEITVTGKSSAQFKAPQRSGAKPKGTQDDGMSVNVQSRVWNAAELEIAKKKAPKLVNFYEQRLKSALSILALTCRDKAQGMFSIGPASGKPEFLGAGPRELRLVGTNQPDRQPADWTASFLINKPGELKSLMPKEPGKLALTRHDSDRLEGRFEFQTDDGNVSGTFSLQRPKQSWE